MVLIAGAFLPIQAGLNSRLGKAGESPVHASTISFVVGAVALILYLAVTKQTVSWSGIKAAPNLFMDRRNFRCFLCYSYYFSFS